jgi:hypothetical protein
LKSALGAYELTIQPHIQATQKATFHPKNINCALRAFILGEFVNNKQEADAKSKKRRSIGNNFWNFQI